MSNINNKHIPEDLDSLTRKDMIELFKIQVEGHQGFIKEIESLRTQLANANERVKRCEKILSEAPDLTFDEVQKMFSEELNKFAIEKKIEALEFILGRVEPVTVSHVVKDHIVYYIEQLRKEQE